MNTLGTVRFQLDPRIDPSTLSPIFRRARRLRIPGILRQDGAEALYRHLATEPRWSLVLHDGDGFNFLYEHRRVPENASERARDPSLLARFVDFLNSDAFIGFARKLTGIH